jgi:O-antigen/teichoic acid export membrane protein/glycosyltransferase involved in cell wall biosynthesis
MMPGGDPSGQSQTIPLAYSGRGEPEATVATQPRPLLLAVLSEPLLRHGLILTAATTVLNVTNWLYHTVMSRMLGPVDYGGLGALLGLLFIFTVPVSAVQMGLSAFVARARAEGRQSSVAGVLAVHLKYFLGAGVATFVALAGLSGWLMRAMQLDSALPVVITGTVIISWAILPVLRGILQGLQRFWDLGASLVCEAVLKLASGFVLVRAGMGLSGAVAGISIGALGATVLTALALRPWGRSGQETGAHEFREILKSVVPYAVTLGCFAILTQGDVVLVKALFPPREAGLYTAASTGGKIVLYLTAALPMVMLPEMARRQATGEDGSHVLRRALLYAGVAGGALVAAYFVAPVSIISLLFGRAYAPAAGLLGLLGLGMLAYEMAIVMIYHHLTIGRSGVPRSVVALAILFPLLAWILPTSMAGMALLVGLLGLAVMVAAWLVVMRARRPMPGVLCNSSGPKSPMDAPVEADTIQQVNVPPMCWSSGTASDVSGSQCRQAAAGLLRRIVVVSNYPPDRRPLSEYGYHLVKSLKRTNPAADVIVISGKAQGLPSVDGNVHRVWPFGSPLAAAHIIRAVHRAAPDLALFNVNFTMWGSHLSAFFCLLTPWLVRKCGVPTIVVIHDLPQTTRPEAAGYKYTLVHRAAVHLACSALARADVVAFPLRSNAHFFKTRFRRARCSYIPHGLLGSPAFLKPAALSSFPHVLVFGKWGKSKDPEPVIRAVLRHPAARITVAGDSAYDRPRYMEHLRAKYASDRVNFIGYVEEEAVASVFQRAHLVVLPHRVSPGPSGVLMLACQYGKAILASETPIFREMQQELGIRIHYYADEDELFEQLKALLADPDKLIEEGRVNYEAVRHLTGEKIAKQYWELALELVQRRGTFLNNFSRFLNKLGPEAAQRR